MAKKDNGAAENTTAALEQKETVYSAADLAAAARIRFNVPPEVAGIALKTAGKDKATITEAERIIKDFMERKVK